MDLLRSLKLSDVPTSQRGVIALSGSDTLNQAFQTLVKNDILGAPVINKKEDSHSFKVRFVVDLYSEDERLFEHDLHEMMAKSGTHDTHKVFTVQHVADLSHFDPCVPVAEGADLSKVADALATGLHRVIVVDHEGNLKNIITQSAIIDLLWKHRQQLGDLLEQTLFDLNLGAKEVAVVKTSDLAIDAFRKIVDKKISAVGVVNHDGVLVGNVSARDLRSATKSKETVKNLYSVVTEFLSYKSADTQVPATAITCRPSDKFGYLLEKIHENRIHRVYIVNEQHHPVGVVSLKDILELFSRLDSERMRVKAEAVLHQASTVGPDL